MKKIICLILLSAFLLSLISCGGGDTADTSDTAAETGKEEYVPTDISSVPAPFSVNGVDVPYGVYRYYFYNVQYKYDGGDKSFWEDNEYTTEIREEVLRYIRRICAVHECAEKYGISLTDAEKNQIDQTIMSERLQYEDDEYYKALDGNFLTEDAYRYLEQTEQLEDDLLAYLTSKDSGPKISDNKTLIQRYIDNYVIRCDHILILNNDGDDKNENETLAKELREKLAAGADFEELKEKYSEDEKTNYSDVGYYITEGDISQILSDTAFSLEEGQISDVIYAPYGYHIVIRLPKDEDYIESNLTDTFLSFYQSHMFEEMLKKIINNQTVVYDDSYYTYTPSTLK